MLWLGGFLSLDLTTSTPDALCPPLEDARAAIHARVGEVRGEYHAEFALIRADDGRQVLALSLREKDAEVLRRELPLDAGGCQDAAQTIALVLERYFDAIERPNEAPPPSSEVGVPETRDRATPRPRPVVPATEPAPARPFGLRTGLLYDREVGVAALIGASYYPNAWRLGARWRWSVGLEAAPFFARQVEVVRGQRVEAFLLHAALSLPLTWYRAPWRVAFGPWAQLRLQRAQASSFDQDRSAFRALPGFGGVVQMGVELAPSWALLAGVAAGPQLRDSAARYVLQGDAGEVAVLVPDPWFGHCQLALELKL